MARIQHLTYSRAPWPTKKFVRIFFAHGEQVEGYNITVRQNGLTGPWGPTSDADHPKRYAFYRVTRVDPASADRHYPRALLLDYGTSPRKPRVSVERLIHDYLVRPDAGNPDITLGKAYFAFGPRRVLSNFLSSSSYGPLTGRPLTWSDSDKSEGDCVLFVSSEHSVEYP